MLGYVFGVTMAFSAVVALALGLFDITAAVNGPRQHRPVIAQKVMVETQRRHSQVAKETSAAKDVTPVVATATDTHKSKHHKPKVFARQRDNYYWNARGYAQRDFFFR